LKGNVLAVCRGLQRGKPKEPVGIGFFREGWGLIGDAHAGTAKEVSLLLKPRVEILSRLTGMFFPPGAFAENLLVNGIPQEDLVPPRCLRIGSVILEITKVGKDPDEAHSYNYYGYSLLPRFGVFAHVLRSGWVLAGDEIQVIDPTHSD